MLTAYGAFSSAPTPSSGEFKRKPRARVPIARPPEITAMRIADFLDRLHSASTKPITMNRKLSKYVSLERRPARTRVEKQMKRKTFCLIDTNASTPARRRARDKSDGKSQVEKM